MEKALGEVSNFNLNMLKEHCFNAEKIENKELFEQQIRQAYLEVKEIIHKLLHSKTEVEYLKNIAYMLIEFYNLGGLRAELDSVILENHKSRLVGKNEDSMFSRRWVDMTSKQPKLLREI